MPGQANAIVQRLKTDTHVRYHDDWKVITFFIGGNDLCDYCHDQVTNNVIVELTSEFTLSMSSDTEIAQEKKCVDFLIRFTTNWLNDYDRMATRPPTTFVTWGMPLTSCITMFLSCLSTWWRYSILPPSLPWMVDSCAILYTSKKKIQFKVHCLFSKRDNSNGLWHLKIFYHYFLSQKSHFTWKLFFPLSCILEGCKNATVVQA